ncbi:MAG TPA: glycosyltransferase [Candidatus Dormibacteraeota bacterium]|nr:glycosyltransferase [Candidatus Dormibacteraeota bacterium]
MKIAFFTDSYLPRADGVAYSIETFRVELEKLGHEVHVIAPAPGLRYKEKSPNILRFPAVKGLVFDDYLTSIFFPPQALLKIKKINPDIVHYHTPGQIGLLGAYYAIHNRKPLVTTYHSDLYEYVTYYPQVLPGAIALSMLSPLITGGKMDDLRFALSSIKPERNVDAWNQKIIVKGITMLHNYCDRVIVPSIKIEQQLRSWKTKSLIRVLPTGVDKITTTTRAAKLFRERYGLKESDQVILFVGRLGDEKSVDLLITAFAIIAPSHPKAKLVLIGRHEKQDKLVRQAKNLGVADRVVFTGRIERSRLGAAYKVATVFAFPSTTDTQGLVIQEAAWAGLPIVMIDHDITNVVIDKVNGLFSRNNARSFARRLSQVLTNDRLRQDMGEASIKLAAKYSAERQAKQLARLYETVLKGHINAKKPPKRRFRLPARLPKK